MLNLLAPLGHTSGDLSPTVRTPPQGEQSQCSYCPHAIKPSFPGCVCQSMKLRAGYCRRPA